MPAAECSGAAAGAELCTCPAKAAGAIANITRTAMATSAVADGMNRGLPDVLMLDVLIMVASLLRSTSLLGSSRWLLHLDSLQLRKHV